MKKLILCVLALIFATGLRAQEYPQLGAKLDEYFTALAGESAQVQNAECDFLISSCTDSLVRQYVALKIYDHYLNSKIMGDDAVAVHVAREWFLSGKVAMHAQEDLLNAKVFVAFNEHSLIGMDAPFLTLQTPSGDSLRVPASGGYSVLYFYDTSCSVCKATTAQLGAFVADEPSVTVYAIYVGADAAAFAGIILLMWLPALSISKIDPAQTVKAD